MPAMAICASSKPDQPAEHRQHDRLDQELHQHLARDRADRQADADLARAFGHRTSMMFMMPIPPTTRLIPATAVDDAGRAAWSIPVSVSVICAVSKMLKLSSAPA